MSAAKSQKPDSDIFVMEAKVPHGIEYRVFPSPHIVRRSDPVIQFRNLTGREVVLDLSQVPVNPKALTLGPRATGTATMDPEAQAGLYEYAVKVPDLGITATGGSSPKVIIDI